MTFENPDLRLSAEQSVEGQVTWKSPSNLALIKYWGKHGRQLPRNPSISLTLENAFTQTTVSYRSKAESGIALQFFFHDEPNPAFGGKVQAFLEGMLPIFPFLEQLELTIHSYNSFPHSAGIASSASSMSALALCLCSMEAELFDTLQDDDEFDQKASFVARLGSGSACRSIFPGMAVWGATPAVEGSSNLYAVPFLEELHEVFHDFHDDILIVSQSEKAVSSRAGHALMDNNTYAAPRYAQANQRMEQLVDMLKTGDVHGMGTITENEALTLHALMMSSSPSYTLMRPNSLLMIEKIRAFRQDTGHPVFFSLDAGPNIHLLYPESVIHEVRPFIQEELLPLCEDGLWINDWVGQGPEEL